MKFINLEIDYEGLSARKVTDKYIRENYDLKKLAEENSSLVPEVSHVPISKLYFAKEMSVDMYLGILQNQFKGNDTIRTIRTPQGMFFELVKNVEVSVTEKEVSEELKKYIKESLKKV